MTSDLDLAPEQLRDLGYAAIDLIARYYQDLPHLPILRNATSRELRELLSEPAPAGGTDVSAMLDIARQTIFGNCRHNGHPRFFGYVASPGTPVSSIADLLIAAFNVNVTSWRSAPGPTEVEHVVIGWIKQILGYPPEAAGLFVSGGSMANFAALAAARAAKAPEIGRTGAQSGQAALRIYASDQCHFSVAKAAGMLGIGQDNVVSVPTGPDFRLDSERLDAAIRQDTGPARVPMCIVASAGTVASGAFDPIGEIAEVARRHGAWLHVDGAYGGFAALAPSARPLFRDIALADSVALDPHKWLYTSMGCGCVLYRNANAARAAFGHEADYTRPIGLFADESFVFWDFGPELSRRFRALNVWFQIKAYGTDRLGQAMERNLRCARFFERLVVEADDLEMLAPVELSIFCFRYAPPGFTGSLDELNERVLVALQRAGHSYVSNAKLHGRFALRGCVLNHRTTEEDMRALLEDVREAGHTVLREMA